MRLLFPVRQQHVCLTGFGITETAPPPFTPLSQVAQPLGSQKALQRLDRGLNEALLASKCPLIPTHRFHTGDGENKERLKRKSEGEKKIYPVV